MEYLKDDGAIERIAESVIKEFSGVEELKDVRVAYQKGMGKKESGGMKCVLMSIRPKWTELIFSGEKTLEVRKTRPKAELPFKCFIYESRAPDRVSSGGRGRVVGEFICDRIFPVSERAMVRKGTLQAACLSKQEYEAYRNGGTIYLWHISDPVIYDMPRELYDFRNQGERLRFAPQSWCYVEDREEDNNE